MSWEINDDRRRFLGTAVMTIAAAELVMTGSAFAQPGKAIPADAALIKPGTNTSFGPLKQIDAGDDQPGREHRQKQPGLEDVRHELAPRDLDGRARSKVTVAKRFLGVKCLDLPNDGRYTGQV